MTSPAIMPRIVLACAALAAGCAFKADYAGGTYLCADGKCPSGLTCRMDNTCGPPIDARVDAPLHDAVDAHIAALTCADPGLFPPGGGSTIGTTTNGTNKVSASCGGFVMNGYDAIYRVDANVGDHIMVTISGNFAVNAYVFSPCTLAPSTPACVGNVLASSGNPINVTAPATTQYFIVVDTPNPTQSGNYSLSVVH